MELQMFNILIYLQDSYGNMYSIPIYIVIVIYLLSIFATFIISTFRTEITNKLRRKILKRTVFQESFSNGNKFGWNLNFWNNSGDQNANTIQRGFMEFRAEKQNLILPEKGFGAYIDIGSDAELSPNTYYKVSCLVTADSDTTMSFQLWVHDTSDKYNSYSVFQPKKPLMMKNKNRVLSLNFQTNNKAMMRIHLLALPGSGAIKVKKVTVEKIG